MGRPSGTAGTYVLKAGDTMTGPLVLPADPVSANAGGGQALCGYERGGGRWRRESGELVSLEAFGKPDHNPAYRDKPLSVKSD